MDMVALGAKIRRFRKDLGLSQETLAERVGVSPVYICMIENGKRTLSLTLLSQIADVLNTTVSELTSENNPNKTYHAVDRVSILFEDCSEYEEQVLLAMLVFMKSALQNR